MSNDTVVLFNGTGTDDQPALWVTSGTAGTTSEVEADLDPQSITNFNGEALFAGVPPGGDLPTGLWVTSGTAGSTVEIGGSGSVDIADANPNGLQPGYFEVYKGEALFQGAAGTAGNEVFGLWETNGTMSGTVEIGGNKNAGIKHADPNGLIEAPPDFTRFDGEVLFKGYDNKGEVGLWITNGTAAGTLELAPIGGAAFGSPVSPTGFDIQPQYMAVRGSEVIFDGADQEDTAGSLWVTNGTAAGTVEIGGEGNKGIAHVPFSDPAHDLPDGLQPYDLTTFGNEVLFAGEDNTLFNDDTFNHTFTLWETNGTAAGTVEIGGFGNAAITEANTAANGGIFDEGSVSNPDFTVFGSEVLFIGMDTGGHVGLWETNGTASGTIEIGGLGGTGLSSTLGFSTTDNPDFTVYGGEVLFEGRNASNQQTLWETNGTASGTKEIDTAAIAPSDMTLFTSGAELAVVSISQNPTSGSGADLKAGKTVSITLDMTENAFVTGTPKLALNDGGFATYAGGAGTPDLTFKYTVAAGQNISDLEIVSGSLVGATITDAGGFHADLSAVSGTNLGIKIDTIAPTVSGVTVTPVSGTTLKLGSTAKIDLDLSKPVVVSGTPTLKLSDGGIATYNSGSSDPATGVLEFDYTVTTNQSSADLTIVSASVTGASIADSAGNAANLALSTTEKNLHLGVNGIPPVVTAATAVASPAGTDVTSGGTVAITLKLSQDVTVTGTPILELSDGGTAHYVSGTSTSSLVFDYTVGSESTNDLRISGVSGTIADAIGNDLSSSLTSDLKLEVNVFTFTHTVSGGGSWNSSGDWTPAGIPSAGNIALITKTGTYAVSSTENNSVAVIETEADATLVVGGGTVFDVTSGTGTGTNAGKIAVDSGGTLKLAGRFVNGGLTTLSGATPTLLELDGVAISGGKLQTSGAGALIETVSTTTNSINGATLVAGSVEDVVKGSTLTWSGGTIGSGATVDASSGSTAIVSGVLTDAGTVILSGTTSVGLHATLETLTDGTAILSGAAITNSGLLFANGAHSLIEIRGGAISGSGSAEVGNGVIDIAGTGDGETVTFVSTGTGGLVIDDTASHLTAFSGAILDFGVGLAGKRKHPVPTPHVNHAEYIALSSVDFVSGAISGSYDTSTHVLTVTSTGVDVAEITVSGGYATADFRYTSGSGGTVKITDPERRSRVAGGSVQPIAVQSANLGLLANYIANFSATGAGGILISSTGQSEPVPPLLVRPHG